jgi:hypothetical protein
LNEKKLSLDVKEKRGFCAQPTLIVPLLANLMPAKSIKGRRACLVLSHLLILFPIQQLFFTHSFPSSFCSFAIGKYIYILYIIYHLTSLHTPRFLPSKIPYSLVEAVMDYTSTGAATPMSQGIQEYTGNEKTHSRSTSSGSTVQQYPGGEPIDLEKVVVGSYTPTPLTPTSTKDGEEPSATNTNTAPPDGGYGWVVVGACFLNNFSMLGIMFSWGIFQQLYKDEVFPGQTSAVSWIGTLAFGFMYIVGGVCSLFAAKIGYRKMILMGSVLVAGGCVGASFATQVQLRKKDNVPS